MSTPTFLTKNEAFIVASVTGVTFPASLTQWTTWSGGDPTAATSQLLPGGVLKSQAQPGPITRTNVTVTCPYSEEVHALRATIEACLNHLMTASYTPTDADGNQNDVTTTITGLLKEPQFPNWDAKSGETVFLGLVMEANG
jgi:hypothetical protein